MTKKLVNKMTNPIYYVDIPNWMDWSTWKNVETFDTLEEALKFCTEVFGADEDGKVSLITEGQSLDEDE